MGTIARTRGFGFFTFGFFRRLDGVFGTASFVGRFGGYFIHAAIYEAPGDESADESAYV